MSTCEWLREDFSIFSQPLCACHVSTLSLSLFLFFPFFLPTQRLSSSSSFSILFPFSPASHAHTYPSPPSSLFPFFSPFSSFLFSSTIHPHTREREGCRVKESRRGRGLPAGKGRSSHVAAQEKERRRRRNRRSGHGLLWG
jgi:hypothetical protein